jgi:aspartyl/asparaginyl-tRNA synthetase
MNIKVTNLAQFETTLVGQYVEIIGKVLHRRTHRTFALIEFGVQDGCIEVLVKTGIVQSKKIQIGSAAWVEGEVYISSKGKKCISCINLKIISKPYSYAPEDEELKSIVKCRSKLDNIVRSFFSRKGLLEVDSKVLQGYMDSPLTSHFITNSKNGREYFLRTTIEVSLRRYVYRTRLPVFEIGHCFRNIDILSDAVNEYKILEAQIPFEDLSYGLSIFGELLRTLEDSFQVEGKLTPTTIVDVRDYPNLTDMADVRSIRKKYRALMESLTLPALMIYSPSLLSRLSRKIEGGYSVDTKYWSTAGNAAQVSEPEVDYNKIRSLFAEQAAYISKTI